MTEHNKLQITVCFIGVAVILLGVAGILRNGSISELEERVAALEAPLEVSVTFKPAVDANEFPYPEIDYGGAGQEPWCDPEMMATYEIVDEPAYATRTDLQVPWCAPDCEWVE